jgi:hypothetical protein
MCQSIPQRRTFLLEERQSICRKHALMLTYGFGVLNLGILDKPECFPHGNERRREGCWGTLCKCVREEVSHLFVRAWWLREDKRLSRISCELFLVWRNERACVKWQSFLKAPAYSASTDTPHADRPSPIYVRHSVPLDQLGCPKRLCWSRCHFYPVKLTNPLHGPLNL